MKIKVSEATGPVLDWMVAKCLGADFVHGDCEYSTISDKVWARGGSQERRYSTDWSHGGPIIERERIGVYQSDRGGWHGQYPGWLSDPLRRHPYIAGPTPLIAAMRCFVASKLGDEVEVPTELT